MHQTLKLLPKNVAALESAFKVNMSKSSEPLYQIPGIQVLSFVWKSGIMMSIFVFLLIIVSVIGSLHLPSGWAMAKTPEGRIYYYHVQTKETRWDPPPAAAAKKAVGERLVAGVRQPRKPSRRGVTTGAPTLAPVARSAPSPRSEPPRLGPQTQGQSQRDEAGFEKQMSGLLAQLNSSQAQCTALRCSLDESEKEKTRLRALNEELRVNTSKALSHVRDQEREINGLLAELEMREAELRDASTRVETAGAVAVKTMSAALSKTSTSVLSAVSMMREKRRTSKEEKSLRKEAKKVKKGKSGGGTSNDEAGLEVERGGVDVSAPPQPLPSPTSKSKAKIKKLKANVTMLKSTVTLLEDRVADRDSAIKALAQELLVSGANEAEAKKEMTTRLLAADKTSKGYNAALTSAQAELVQLRGIVDAKQALQREKDEDLRRLGETCQELEQELMQLRRAVLERDVAVSDLVKQLEKPWYLIMCQRFIELLKRAPVNLQHGTELFRERSAETK